jgi:predicted RNA-binding protein
MGKKSDGKPEGKMCLSNVYIDLGDEEKEIMKDVARIEAEGQGFWMINLFGERKYVEGVIETIDFENGHYVRLRKEEAGLTLSI